MSRAVALSFNITTRKNVYCNKKNQVPFLLMAVDILGRIYVQDILNERLEALKLKKVFKPPSIQEHCPR